MPKFSLRLDIRLGDDVAVIADLGTHEGAELIDRQCRHHRAVLLQPRLDVGFEDHLVDRRIETCCEVKRRAARAEERGPQRKIEIR